MNARRISFRFAIDADGVLFNFDASWRICAERMLRRDLPVVQPVYDLSSRYALSRAEMAKVWAAWNTAECWRTVQPISSAINVTRMLIDMGHSVTVVTKLPSEKAAEERRWCLDHHGLFEADLVTVKDSKKSALAKLRPHFYADDLLFHCLEAKDVFVPHIVKIESCGFGEVPDGIEKHKELETAIREFFQTAKRQLVS
ncbi:hypothetical protein HFQ13_10460 [Acidithiobacillus sp. VAN18-1]|uniref:Uncharacterized protein n=1 Tax=Igneacidithiobacillus copahuensis TaxID=2724909 RepID=A0AAE2YQQ7_9PROT|nr:hypothetical protein [Igneacidithiobacillus copahuensis]MBU2788612.1 hypothetical protein [Igneacidithiobacillus copahuensis]MBU2796704.1 hypothetical protein [Acidithiobacillus sp. VAN18-2]